MMEKDCLCKSFDEVIKAAQNKMRMASKAKDNESSAILYDMILAFHEQKEKLCLNCTCFINHSDLQQYDIKMSRDERKEKI